jgi:hypothetical protein
MKRDNCSLPESVMVVIIMMIIINDLIILRIAPAGRRIKCDARQEVLLSRYLPCRVLY